MHGVLRVERAGIAVEKAFAEMHQYTLTLLCLARERELLQELPECLVKRLFLELEVAKVFVSHGATKLVAVGR